MKAKLYLFLSLFLLFSLPSIAQNAGDYRTMASGDWNATITWQTFDGSSWVAATTYPTAADGYIIVSGGHILTLPASFSVTADQVIVQENARVHIAASATLELVNGTGTDLDIAQAVTGAIPGIVQVSGTLKANNETGISSQGNSLFIEDGGMYQHHYTLNSGSIPLATWNAGSTLLISGYTSNELAPGNLGQAFHHVVWNTPDLNNTQGLINLGGLLNTVQGNLTVQSTGTNTLSFASDNSADVLAIAQSFRIRNGSSVLLNSTVQVSDTLAISNSSLENTSGLTLADGATFLLEGATGFSGVSPLSTGKYSVTYKDISTAVSPGLEFPNPETGLENLKIANSTLNLSNPVTVHGNLILESLGTLRLTRTDLFLKGSFANHGTFEASTNKVTFNGQTPQTLEGTVASTFHDLEIINTANPGLVANSHINISNSLILGEGVTFDPDGGDLATDGGVNVTLLSEAYNQSAYVAPLPTTAQIAGNIVLQHYIPPVKMYRYLTTATKGLTLEQWTDDFVIYGSYEGGPGGNASLYIFDEPQGTYLAYPGSSGSLSSPIEVGKGYAAYMYNGTTPTIIDTRGEVQTGDFTFPLTFTESSSKKGVNFIGNPYPGAIEWASPNWRRNNISPSVVLYKPVGGKEVYSTLNAITGIGLNAANTRIGSGEGFYINTLAPDASLTATEAVKVTSTDNLPQQAIQDVVVVTFTGGGFSDQMALAFREGTTALFDSLYDSKKIKNTSINIYSYTTDNENLSQDIQPWFQCNTVVPLAIDQAVEGTYQLSFSHLESLSRGIEIILQDNYLSTSTAVNAETVYNFDITADPLTFGKNRFSLILTNETIPEISSITYEGSCTGSIPVTVNGTVSGINYQLFKGTTAVTGAISATSDVTSFSINAADLTEGTNTISVQAFHTGCEPITMATELQLEYSGNYTISSTEGATSCAAASLTLSATASSANSSYKWYETLDAATAVHEGTTGSFTTPVLEQSATYYVAAVNTYGCESERVAVEATVVIPQLTALSYEESCKETIPVSVNGTMGGINYQLFNGATAVSDVVTATSASTTLAAQAAGLAEGSNTLTVIATSNGCEVSMDNTLQLEYSGNYSISSTEGATSCTAASLTLSATASSANAGYKWYQTIDATTAVHEGTTGSFTTSVLEHSSTYYVAAVNAYGCESERVAVEAVIQNLDKPVIRIEEDALISSYATGNQWLLNGAPIENASDTFFIPTESGTYGLEVNFNNCDLVADAVDFTVTGISKEKIENTFSLYPNPVQSSFKIKSALFEANEKVTYYIYQHNGTVVQQGSITTAETEIIVENLNPGLYLVRLTAGKKIQYSKLIKGK